MSETTTKLFSPLKSMAELTQKAFLKSLCTQDEVHTEHVSVTGITTIFNFHPQRLENYRELVTSILAEVSPDFQEGYTFLSLCLTKKGEIWTDDRQICEELMAMAIGLDLMAYCIPRERWIILPGGVPYLILKKKS